MRRIQSYGTKEYVEFVRGTRKTAHGFTFEQILNYGAGDLERDHAYIQWIFPLPTASMFNSDAPILDIRELQNYPDVKEAMLRSAAKLTEFWGIGKDGVVDARKIRCLNGHNGLRFSRYLQSMVYHGHEAIAAASLETVKNNLGLLSPTLGRSGKTLWEELFLEAKAAMLDLASLSS